MVKGSMLGRNTQHHTADIRHKAWHAVSVQGMVVLILVLTMTLNIIGYYRELTLGQRKSRTPCFFFSSEFIILNTDHLQLAYMSQENLLLKIQILKGKPNESEE
jgi:hypothetical protein